MQNIIKEVSEGVEILYIPDSRFKTTYASVNFYLPLDKNTVSCYSLLSALLSSCSAKYEDFSKLNCRLDELYGANLNTSALKTGNCLCLKFSVSTINNKYAFKGEKPFSEVIKLLFELIFEPKCEDGTFFDEDIKREKRKLIEHICGELNDKRMYARTKLINEMFEDDAYGVYCYGTKEDVEKVTGTELFSAWKTMLASAFIRVHIIGADRPDDLESIITQRFSLVERKTITDCKIITALKQRENVKRIDERMNISQGKLVMGFNCNSCEDSAVKNMVMCDIFGGGPYSHLFTNVREKLSLCYYCSASTVRNKGFIMVDSGVEEEKSHQAEEEILNQLRAVKDGEFTDFQFNSSKKSISDSLNTVFDSISGIDSWYTLRVIDNIVYTPDEIIEKIKQVSREDIIALAKEVKLNTVYRLLPQERE